MQTIGAGLSAALFLFVAAPSSAATLDPDSTGCPSLNTTGAVTRQPAADLPTEVGPIGTTNQRLAGATLEVIGDKLVGTVHVQNMAKQILPPYKATYWQLRFTVVETNATYAMTGVYDGIDDRWRYTLIQGVASYRGEIAGAPTFGPGGGVTMTAPLTQFKAAPGMTLSRVHTESGAMTYYPQPPYPPEGGGVWAPRWMKDAFETFPLIPCPGISLYAEFVGDQVAVLGYALPLESQPVTIEVRSLDAAIGQVSLTTDESGRYVSGIALSDGVYMLRASVTTRAFGIVESDPITITVDN